uniref:TSA: Wollemia nobilis Ref_Wollemi_Transcript_14414_1728 transcribed RNA sequence n=1 Tax=Wollemia nobilis TaxID=56998 RepID=A0A0C9RJN4_9CONI
MNSLLFFLSVVLCARMGDIPEEDIVIVGGGVAGLATALALHRVGLKSLLLERADSLRTAGAAFMMWPNAWKALDALGVAHSLRQNYSLLDGISGCSNCTGVQKDVLLEKRGKGGVSWKLESRCIERMALLEVLAKALPQGSVKFNSKIVSLYKNSSSPFTTLDLADGTSMRAKIVIGCDGVYSLVAKWIGLPPIKSSGRFALRGMVTYPQGHDLDKLMAQVWGKGVKAGFIPCTDKQVYWFIATRLHPKDAKILGDADAETVRRWALELVREFGGPVAELIKSSPAETLNLAEIKLRWAWVWPWQWEWKKLFGKGSVTVVGDALHPVMPDLGQGACLALEDAIVLARCLGNAISDVNIARWGHEDEKTIQSCFKQFLHQRKWRMFAISNGSFVMGNVQDGCSKFMRFVRDRIFSPLFSMSYFLFFAKYDCGALPILSHSRGSSSSSSQ